MLIKHASIKATRFHFKRWLYPALFSALCGASPLAGSAQNVQWADRVIAFSSQGTKTSYSARQVLGPPNKLPASGDCGCAWSPGVIDTEWGKDPEKPEYIKVGFARPMRVKQVLLAENFRPGSVRRVWLYDLQNQEELVYERKANSPALNPEQSRLFHIPIERSRLKVASLKIELDPEAVSSPPQIDAIGISDQNKLLKWEVQPSKSFSLYGDASDLGPAINSPFAELLPRFSPDGQTMYFDRKDHPENYGGFINDDIWVSELDDQGNWTLARNMGSPLNNPYHNYVCGVSNDGVLSLYGQYSSDGIPMPGIAQSFRFMDQWAFPMNLNIEQLYNGNPYAEYYMSNDRRTLVMSIEGIDTKGGKDLYISFSDDQINWSKPLNMGGVLNTGGHEMSPWLSNDGRMLIFSSDAHSGYGEQDIFVSYRNGASWSDWSRPENLGPQVNTSGWESHFVPDPLGRYAYFARATDRLGGTDLLRIAMVEELAEAVEQIAGAEPEYPFEPRYTLFGYVQDGSNGRYIQANILVRMSQDSTRQLSMSTTNNQYKLRIEDGVEYEFLVKAEGYEEQRLRLRMDEFGNTGVRRRDFKLYPPGMNPAKSGIAQLEPGSLFSLETLLFRVNSPVISRESYPELNLLAASLKEKPEVKIRVEGHTNSNCAKRYCDKLSQNRAKRVADYLMEQGIGKERVRWTGYGKDRPVADNESEEGRRLNQRVDIRVE